MIRQRTRTDTLLGIYLGALSVAGAVMTAFLPAEVLRAMPFSSLVSFVSAGLGLVAAEAVWNARPWRYNVMIAAVLVRSVGGLERAVNDARGGPGMLPWPVMIVQGLLMTSMLVLYVRHIRRTRMARVRV